MKRSAPALPLSLIAGALILACVDIPTGTDELLSFQINALPSPSVVVGDSLRDTAGVVAPLSVTAFNYLGEPVEGAQVTFSALDSRVRVNGATGIVIGDSVSATASRVLASLDGFSGIIPIRVVLRPDTVIGANVRDTLSYSLTDTAANLSDGLGVRVLHGLLTTDSAVQSFRVTFDIVAAAHPELARLVNDAGSATSVDTTDASGVANRRIRLDVSRLVAAVDSVIVMASVKYRGQHVRGSPTRLVLEVKPR